MATLTNYLTSLFKKNSSFSITDQQGNALVTELKIKRVMVNEHADSAKQPLYLTQNTIHQKTTTIVTEADLNHAHEVTVTSTKINHDVDLVFSKIIDPSSFTIDCFCPTLTTCNVLLKLFKNVTDTYTITSKDIKIRNMMITDLQFRIQEDVLSAYLCTLIFQEVFSPDKTYSPLKDGDQDTVGMTITPHSVLNKVEDLAKSMVKKLG